MMDGRRAAAAILFGTGHASTTINNIIISTMDHSPLIHTLSLHEKARYARFSTRFLLARHEILSRYFREIVSATRCFLFYNVDAPADTYILPRHTAPTRHRRRRGLARRIISRMCLLLFDSLSGARPRRTKSRNTTLMLIMMRRYFSHYSCSSKVYQAYTGFAFDYVNIDAM